MGCGMVLTYALSVVGIHCQLCLVSHSNCSGYDLTHMHPIKSTLKAAIDYILNPEKTDGKLLA